MQNSFVTERLLLTEINGNDAEFITVLVNTPEWIKFIGDRHVKTREDALGFIQRIVDDPNKHYWTVKLPDQNAIGVVTFMKRDYLAHYDIGFAFLSEYTKHGYAYEAALAVLKEVIKNPSHTHVQATTIDGNSNSIRLLKKLGLRFEKHVQHANEALSVYSVLVDNLLLNELTREFFGLFTNARHAQPGWEKIYSLCLPETVIIKKTSDGQEVFNLDSFLEPRKRILSDGTLTEFEEYETGEETRVVGNLAQRFSNFEKKGYLNGKYFEGKGNKLFQFIKTSTGWRINSVVWEDVS